MAVEQQAVVGDAVVTPDPLAARVDDALVRLGDVDLELETVIRRLNL